MSVTLAMLSGNPGKEDSALSARRECVFCGGTPLSREHVLPRWAGDLLEKPHGHLRPSVRDTGGKRHGWMRSGLEWVSRRVCVPCNTGWMSRLEADAAPVLAPLIKSLSRARLRRKDVPLVAQWVAKTSLVGSLIVESDPPIIPPWQYQLFYKGQGPDLRIWIGGYDYREHGHSPFSVSIYRIDPIEYNVWRSTINVGCLVGVVFCGGRGLLPEQMEPPDQMRPFLRSLHQPPWRGLRWPPERVMGSDDLQLVSGLTSEIWRDSW